MNALRFALLAIFGHVLESHNVKENLFACRKYEITAAIGALQVRIDIIHNSRSEERHTCYCL
jgi:hypothetical protein